MTLMRKVAISIFLGACLGWLVPAAMAAELPEGTVIDKSNIDRIKNDTFEGKTIGSMLTEKVEWQIRTWGLTIRLVHSKPVELDPKLVAATKKYAGDVKYDPKNHEVSGYKAGIPFPDIDPKDPEAGFKIVWNFYYASPEGDSVDGIFDFVLVDGNKGVERRTSWKFFKYFMKGRLKDGVPPVAGDGSIHFKYFYIAVAPRDLKGTGTFTVGYDSKRPDDTWAYIKSVRRIRQLSGGAWMDPVGGMDQMYDEIYVFSARPSRFPAMKLLEKRWILASVHNTKKWNKAFKGTNSQEEFPMVDLKTPPYWNPLVDWEPREVWVVEIKAPAENPYNSRRIIYADTVAPHFYYSENYDKKGDFYKFVFFPMQELKGADGYKAWSGDICGWWINFKRRHASLFIAQDFVINPPYADENSLTLKLLEETAR